MPSVNDQLADDFVPRIVDLLRFTEHERIVILVLLEQLSKELTQKVIDAELQGKAMGDSIRRLVAIKAQADATITNYYKQIQSIHRSASTEIAKWSEVKAVGSINQAIGVEIASVRMTPETIRAIVSNSIIQGHPASSWWAKQAVDVSRNFEGQIRMGMLAGETTEQLARRIHGTATGRSLTSVADGKSTTVREFQGGIMQTTRREAMALVRTSAMAVSANANLQVFRANEDVLRGIAAVVTLDLRTTELCMSRSGAAWDFKGNPLPESRVKIKYPGPVPWHWQCRTVLVPVVKSFNQLLEEAGRPLKRKLSGIPDLKRASMDGAVPAEWNYEDWLKRQTAKRQDQALGPARAQMFRDGKLSLSQLVDPVGRSLTLAQLRNL